MLKAVNHISDEVSFTDIRHSEISPTNIKTWANCDMEEGAMKDDHYHLWMEMIRQIDVADLKDKAVLDYGCNQGGFLNALYEEKGFLKGLGVDIATDSIAYARANKTKENPSQYDHIDALNNRHNHFDVAFSHEVLYLISDLQNHAKQMRGVLKEGGVYYAAIGCHTDNPNWTQWLDLIGLYSNLDVKSYSLDDYADAFFNEGFKVSARPYQIQGFVPLKQNNAYFPKVSDSLLYHSFVKTLFKFEKK